MTYNGASANIGGITYPQDGGNGFALLRHPFHCSTSPVLTIVKLLCNRQRERERVGTVLSMGAVSYTHLTLPTICSV
eukprot:7634847-Prorocentrum_lima.AAC.1